MNNNQLTALVVGSSGTGKSKTCNSLLGYDDYSFQFAANGRTVTQFCLSKTENRSDVSLCLVDTPGISRLYDNESLNVKTINDGLQELSSGASAIIICMRMDRLEDQLDVIKFYERNMGNCLADYAVVVFTHLDQWEEKIRERSETSNPVNEFLLSLPDGMRAFLHKIQNRFIAFNNRLEGEEMDVQVQLVIEKLKEAREHNRGRRTNYSLQQFRKRQNIIWRWKISKTCAKYGYVLASLAVIAMHARK